MGKNRRKHLWFGLAGIGLLALTGCMLRYAIGNFIYLWQVIFSLRRFEYEVHWDCLFYALVFVQMLIELAFSATAAASFLRCGAPKRLRWAGILYLIHFICTLLNNALFESLSVPAVLSQLCRLFILAALLSFGSAWRQYRAEEAETEKPRVWFPFVRELDMFCNRQTPEDACLTQLRATFETLLTGDSTDQTELSAFAAAQTDALACETLLKALDVHIERETLPAQRALQCCAAFAAAIHANATWPARTRARLVERAGKTARRRRAGSDERGML